MELSIRAPQKLTSDALKDHIERRFTGALGRIGHFIRRVEVRVDDVNGPRGGQDKRCSALVAVDGGRALNVEAKAGDAYRAIDQLAERVKRLVFRQRKTALGKRRS